MNHEHRQGRVPHGNGAGFHDYGIRTSQGAVAVASRRSVVTRAPELVGERDVQAVQHAGALAKCVGAPQVLAPQSVEAWIHAAYRQSLGMKPHSVMRPPDWELELDWT